MESLQYRRGWDPLILKKILSYQFLGIEKFSFEGVAPCAIHWTSRIPENYYNYKRPIFLAWYEERCQ
jgi:hypothetical protein